MPEPLNVTEEVRRLRETSHEHTTSLAQHTGMFLEYEVRMENVERSVETLATKADVDHHAETLTLKLDHLKETVDPIKHGIYWMVGLVLAAVIAALLSLVVKG